MAGPLEGHGVGIGRLGQPIEREVPGQRVCPFVAEHLDGLRLVHLVVEEDHEPLIPPKALAQDRFGEPGSPNDDGKGWRAFLPKARQNRLKFAPARAVYETAAMGDKHPGPQMASCRKAPAVAAENGHGTGGATIGNHVCQCSAAERPARSLGDGRSPTT